MRRDRRPTISFSRPLGSAIALAVLAGGCATVEDWTDSLAFRDYPGHRHRAGYSRLEADSTTAPAIAQADRSAEPAQSNSGSADDDIPGEKSNLEQNASGDGEKRPKTADEPLFRLTDYQPQQGDSPLLPDQAPAQRLPEAEVPEPEAPLPPAEKQTGERYPINLGTALQLAGANNLQIALATERVREALARLDGAEVLWLPTLQAGVGYNTHVGQLQATEGDVLEINRESVFVGGGPVLGGSPLPGGTGGPPRLFVGISPVDIYFDPLAARQAAAGAQAGEASVFNETLLRVTVTYFELLQAQSEVAIAEEAIQYAERLVEITEQFAETGAGLRADAERARAALAARRRELADAKQRLRVVSAELARQLRLEPDVILYAAEAQPVPLPLVTEDQPLEELIAQGLSARPEATQRQARVGETLQRVRQEEWRPWIPHLQVGLSSGGFGGGPDGSFGEFSDKTDLDLLAVWELRNLGLGNRALQRERESQHQQAHLQYQQTLDRIAAEITQAYRRVRYQRRQIDRAEEQVQAAARALPLNFQGIRGRALRPIEAQQAIEALAEARNQYLQAVIEYNQAQFTLLQALGRPPEVPETMSAEAASQP